MLDAISMPLRCIAFGLWPAVAFVEHRSDDFASVVADELKYVCDLQISQAIHQPGKKNMLNSIKAPTNTIENIGTAPKLPRSMLAKVKSA